MISFLFLSFSFFLSSFLPFFLSPCEVTGGRGRKRKNGIRKTPMGGRFSLLLFSALGADGREGGMMMLSWRVDGEAIP